MGVDVNTGVVLYECGSSGCGESGATSAKDVLVLRRSSSVVRALDPRTGTERWVLNIKYMNIVTY